MVLYDRLCAHMKDQCDLMLRYAMDSGLPVSASILKALQPLCASDESPPEAPVGADGQAAASNLPQWGRAHAQLAKLIHPATPGALSYLASQRTRQERRWLRVLGPVPLVRGLVAVAAISLFSLLGLSLIEGIDGHLDWANESGLQLLCEELFLLAAAGVGASFNALFRSSRYVARRMYDPQYSTTYWVRLVLGLLSGMILAMLIPLGSVGPLGPEAASSPATDVAGFAKPLLAMLGGFSATIVYRILNRLIHVVESLVAGETSPEDAQGARRQVLDAERAEQQAALIVRLSQVRRNGSVDNPSAWIEGLDRLIDELSGGTSVPPADV